MQIHTQQSTRLTYLMLTLWLFIEFVISEWRVGDQSHYLKQIFVYLHCYHIWCKMIWLIYWLTSYMPVYLCKLGVRNWNFNPYNMLHGKSASDLSAMCHSTNSACQHGLWHSPICSPLLTARVYCRTTRLIPIKVSWGGSKARPGWVLHKHCAARRRGKLGCSSSKTSLYRLCSVSQSEVLGCSSPCVSDCPNC